MATKRNWSQYCDGVSLDPDSKVRRRSTRINKRSNRALPRRTTRGSPNYYEPDHDSFWLESNEEYEEDDEDEQQQSESSEDLEKSKEEEEDGDDDDKENCYDQPSNNHKGQINTPQHDQFSEGQKPPPPPITVLDDEEHTTTTPSNNPTKHQQRPRAILTLRFTSGKLLASGMNNTSQSHTSAASRQQQRATISKDMAQTELSHALANAAAAREEHNRAEAALTRVQRCCDEAASRRDAANKKVDELCEKVMRSRE